MWVTQIFLLTDLGLEKGNNVYPVDTTLDSTSHNIYEITKFGQYTISSFQQNPSKKKKFSTKDLKYS